MNRSIGSTASTPIPVMTALKRKVASIVVSTAAWRPSIFRSPKYRLMTTPAPTEKPLKKNTAILTMIDVDPTAASASFPT